MNATQIKALVIGGLNTLRSTAGFVAMIAPDYLPNGQPNPVDVVAKEVDAALGQAIKIVEGIPL